MQETWKILGSEEVYRSDPWVSVHRQRIALPDGRIISDYHRIQLPDCVGIIAETTGREIVVQSYYRHGIGRGALGIPGGAINPGETPLDAAKREFFEETGYRALNWRALGSFAMNGNYGCGTIHFFHATSLDFVSQPVSGDLEDIETLLKPANELLASIRSGEIPILAAATGLMLALSES